MQHIGIAKLGKRTKSLVKRLKAGDIAIIDHVDLDRVTAESLIDAGVEVVINASSFISGRYPNIGPLLMASEGIYLIDAVEEDVFNQIKEGDEIVVRGDKIFHKGKVLASGKTLTVPIIKEKMEEAKKNIGAELEKFATNTLYYMQKEKDLLLEGMKVPESSVNFNGRHTLIVVRGHHYKADLKILRSYIKEVRPILIGVDGGADALLQEGYKPDIIVGDMDSVSDEALNSGAELIVHAYKDGSAPGLERLKKMNLPSKLFNALGTSEDIAMILAYEKGADLIVAVGTHANLVEFLDKGRAGMASTFLVRLKIGEKLVDAKGVSKLYQSRAKISHLIILVFAAFTTTITIIMSSTTIRGILRLIILKIRLYWGF
ncbi:putative cytokinetic ring protein SteA [Candidatus Oleimmundimicrobium sp.]|uniref:putative cytokinetic ring protein SteA n=1 Tax=Candidatus Oleimmundimicrobium sp. TaxID=3060597 RepID=UPI0027158EF8|nr:putative cytokinetic ring protein SteA [Candidatus Oleimmundimicrobium sp.]MDO8886527.1 putative cytokinetic ring protein SteA [Candidatus Oleimmundimicrobium sp.]